MVPDWRGAGADRRLPVRTPTPAAALGDGQAISPRRSLGHPRGTVVALPQATIQFMAGRFMAALLHENLVGRVCSLLATICGGGRRSEGIGPVGHGPVTAPCLANRPRGRTSARVGNENAPPADRSSGRGRDQRRSRRRHARSRSDGRQPTERESGRTRVRGGPPDCRVACRSHPSSPFRPSQARTPPDGCQFWPGAPGVLPALASSPWSGPQSGAIGPQSCRHAGRDHGNGGLVHQRRPAGAVRIRGTSPRAGPMGAKVRSSEGPWTADAASGQREAGHSSTPSELVDH
jgi:hypothetical protein